MTLRFPKTLRPAALAATACAVIAPVHAVSPADDAWRDVDAFAPLRKELAEIALALDELDILSSAENENDKAALRRQFDQLSAAARPLRIGADAELPPAFAPAEDLDPPASFPAEQWRSAAAARRRAARDLAAAMTEAPDLAAPAAGALHLHGESHPDDVLDALLLGLEAALSGRSIFVDLPGAGMAIPLGSAGLAAELAVDLGRSDELKRLAASSMTRAGHDALLAVRIEKLLALYSASEKGFPAAAADAVASGRVKVDEATAVARFRRVAQDTIVATLKEILETGTATVSAESIAGVIEEGGGENGAELRDLLQRFAASPRVGAGPLVALAKRLSARGSSSCTRYPELALDLADKILGIRSGLSAEQSGAASLLLYRLQGAETVRVGWKAAVGKLLDLTIGTRPSRALRLDDAERARLIGLAIAVDDAARADSLIDLVAPGINDPMAIARWLFVQRRNPFAFRVMAAAPAEKLRPIFRYRNFSAGERERLFQVIGDLMREEPRQLNTLAAILLALSPFENASGSDDIERSKPLLAELAARWSAVDHPRHDLLEVGLVSLFASAQSSCPNEGALPVFLKWIETHPLEETGSATIADASPPARRALKLWSAYLAEPSRGQDAMRRLTRSFHLAADEGDSEALDTLYQRINDLAGSRVQIPIPPGVPENLLIAYAWLIARAPCTSVDEGVEEWHSILERMRGFGIEEANIPAAVTVLLGRMADSSIKGSAMRVVQLAASLCEIDPLSRSPEIKWPSRLGEWDEADYPSPTEVINELTRLYAGREGGLYWACRFLASRTLGYEKEIRRAWSRDFIAAAAGTWLEEPAEICGPDWFSPLSIALADESNRQILKERLPLQLRADLSGLIGRGTALHDRLGTAEPMSRWSIDVFEEVLLSRNASLLPRAEGVFNCAELLSLQKENPEAARDLARRARAAVDVIRGADFAHSPWGERMIKSLDLYLASLNVSEAGEDEPPAIPSDAAPAERLLLLLKANRLDEAAALVADPGGQLDFRRVPGAVLDRGVHERGEQLAAQFDPVRSDLACYVRLLVRSRFHVFDQTQFHPGALIDAERRTLLERFEAAAFEDKALERRCLARLCAARGVSAWIPRKLTNWRASFSNHEFGLFIERFLENGSVRPGMLLGDFAPLLAWAELCGREARADEIERILARTAAPPPAESDAVFRAPSRDKERPNNGSALRGAIALGMLQAFDQPGLTPETASALHGLAKDVWDSARTAPRGFPFVYALLQDLTVAGIWLGRCLADSSAPADASDTAAAIDAIRDLCEKSELFSCAPISEHPVEAALIVLGREARPRSADERKRLFFRVLEVKNTLSPPMLSRSGAPCCVALRANLIDADTAYLCAKLQSETDPLNTWKTLDLAWTCEMTGRDSEAREAIDYLAGLDSSGDQTPLFDSMPVGIARELNRTAPAPSPDATR